MGYVIKENLITVPYEELAPSPDENIARDLITVTRTFKCAWSQRLLFTKQLLGWTEWTGLNHVFHKPHPYKPDADWLSEQTICTEIMSIKGFGGLVESPASTKVAEYAHAVIIAGYKSTEFSLQTYISESVEPSSEYLTLDDTNLYWDSVQTPSNKVKPMEAPGYLLKMFDWVYTFHKLVYLHPALFFNVGFVNQYIVWSRSLGMYFLPGSLLFGDPVMSREYTSYGITMWQVTVRLKARFVPWNYFPRVDRLDYYGYMYWGRLYNENGYLLTPYPYADFSGLII